MQIAQQGTAANTVVGVDVSEPGSSARRSPYADYKIIRRNGAVVGFEPAKISVAMTKAYLAVGGSQGAASARIRDLVTELTASVVKLKIRRADFSTCTRQQQFSPATDETATLQSLAATLLARWLAGNPGVRVRLLGAGVAGLNPSAQLALFEPARSERSA